MSMQMISNEMHSDTIAIRQKKYNLKSGKLYLSLSVFDCQVAIDTIVDHILPI